jgi:hypothetical protein
MTSNNSLAIYLQTARHSCATSVVLGGPVTMSLVAPLVRSDAWEALAHMLNTPSGRLQRLSTSGNARPPNVSSTPAFCSLYILAQKGVTAVLAEALCNLPIDTMALPTTSCTGCASFRVIVALAACISGHTNVCPQRVW